MVGYIVGCHLPSRLSCPFIAASKRWPVSSVADQDPALSFKIIYLYSLLNLYSKVVLYYRFNRICTYVINRINFLYITAGSEIIKKKNIKIRSGPQHCASPNLYHLPLFSVCESGSERIRIFFSGSGIICSGSGKKWKSTNMK